MFRSIISTFYYLFLTVLLCGFAGCKTFDRTEEIPAYVRISSISFTSNYPTQGTQNEKFTDVWVFMDGDLIGAFELPCTFPVLAEGEHAFVIRAGIKMNGTSTTRAIYPVVKGWEGTLNLNRGQAITVTPSMTYFPGAEFVWLEDFDAVGTTFTDSGALVQNVFHLTSNAGEAFEGPRSGYARLDQDSFDLFVRSSLYFPGLNPAYTPLYLELNYRCNQSFSVGVQTAQREYRSVVVIGASENWSKIYINLTDIINRPPASSGYSVYFTMRKSNDIAEPYLFLDNIKVVR
jgi:hypothetical protein